VCIFTNNLYNFTAIACPFSYWTRSTKTCMLLLASKGGFYHFYSPARISSTMASFNNIEDSIVRFDEVRMLERISADRTRLRINSIKSTARVIYLSPIPQRARNSKSRCFSSKLTSIAFQ